MRRIQVDLAGPVPVYRQVADGLRALLVSGQFSPGERLPGVRQLAGDLGVHHNTVAEAYRILAREGWLSLRRRAGAEVLLRNHPDPQPHLAGSFSNRLEEMIAKAISDGLPRPEIASELRRIAGLMVTADLRNDFYDR